MKLVTLAICFLILGLLTISTEAGGGPCIGCLIVASLTTQYSMTHRTSLAQAAKDVCNFMLSDYKLEGTCTNILTPIVELWDEDFKKGHSPDQLCTTIQPECGTCKMFPTWPPKRFSDYQFSPFDLLNNVDTSFQKAVFLADKDYKNFISFVFHKIASFSGLINHEDVAEGNFDDLLSKVVDTNSMLNTHIKEEDREILKNLHKLTGPGPRPAFDTDQDGHADNDIFRGFSWRGKDCNDNDATVYPGRRDHGKTDGDRNCNGIPDDQESTLCQVPQYGVAGLGDSATAHFALPPEWLDPTKINANTYKNLLSVLLHEADWPMCSSTTGFLDASMCPSRGSPGHTKSLKSLYSYVRERNHCIHRDYQNIGVNGADSKRYPTIVKALSRNPRHDYPLLVFYALIGNDVCGKNSTVESMTTVADFEKSTLATLAHLDSILPSGSHVFMADLVDGRVLYETMANKIHPIGTSNAAFFDFLNCHYTSPCSGWMNADPKVRDSTTQHAIQLGKVYPKIVIEKGHTYKNIKIHYIPYMSLFNQIVNEYKAAGAPVSDLIEAADSFHPAGPAQWALAEKVWNFVNNNITTVNIPTNPNNAKIASLFGDQGGYI